MTGDEEVWFEIAERLCMAVSDAKHRVTATEFLRWQEKFHREWNRHTKQDNFLAQVAYEVYLMRYYFATWAGVKDSSPAKFEEFLIKFSFDGKPTEEQKETVTEFEQETTEHLEAIQSQANLSKTAWLVASGMDGAGRPLGDKRIPAKQREVLERRTSGKKKVKKESSLTPERKAELLKALQDMNEKARKAKGG